MQIFKEKSKVKSEIVSLIDETCLLDAEIKEKIKILDENKKKIREYAAENDLEEIAGDLGRIEFSSETKTEIDVMDLYNRMIELNNEAEFFNLVKVNITAVKSKLGNLITEDISKNETKRFAKMRIK